MYIILLQTNTYYIKYIYIIQNNETVFTYSIFYYKNECSKTSNQYNSYYTGISKHQKYWLGIPQTILNQIFKAYFKLKQMFFALTKLNFKEFQKLLTTTLLIFITTHQSFNHIFKKSKQH